MTADSDDIPTPAQPDAPAATSGLGLVLGVAMLALCAVISLLRYIPPAAKPADAPSQEFSAHRARRVLQEILPDAVPHPVGSEANTHARERIVTHLRALGYEPVVRTGFACGRWGTCADVRNIVAHVPARLDRPAILLTAHYDSVPAGPGASDDGVGVATLLEIARILKNDPRPEDPVYLLITDGEEGGLLGARSFVADDPWARDVRVAVGLEARGTTGPSLMFQTGADNAWLVKLFGRAAPRPVSTSIFSTVYERLPNDTDFTVLKAAGITGLNFAFLGNVVRYHTPQDSVSNTDLRTMQHHGDNTLAVVRALVSADLKNTPKGDAVFFDVWGYGLVRWPTGWSLPLAAVALALVAIAIAQLLRQNALTGTRLAWGIAAWPLMLAAPIIAGLVLGWLFRVLTGERAPWTAHPVPAAAAFWLLAFLEVGGVAILLGRRAGLWGLWAGVWTWFAVLGVALAATLPGVSYVGIVPTIAAAGAALLFGATRRPDSAPHAVRAILVSTLCTGALLLPATILFHSALGLGANPAVTGTFALAAMTIAPLFAETDPGVRRRINWIAGAACAVAVVITVVMPAYSERKPRPLNVELHEDDDGGAARWLVSAGSGKAPDALREVVELSDEAILPFPFSTKRWGSAFTAPAESTGAPGPTLRHVEAATTPEGRHLRVRLRSPRGADEIGLFFPPDAPIKRILVDGHLAGPLQEVVRRNLNGWQGISSVTPPPDGIDVVVVIESDAPVQAVLFDRSYGLPPAGRALLEARPPEAGPVGRGDRWIITRRVSL